MSYARAFVVLLLALPLHAAGAQGLMDFLFGPDEAAPARAHGNARPAPGFSPYADAWPFGDLLAAPQYDAAPPPYERTTYRTLCVRMCDGFYFPISYATDSSNFSRDADACTSACGREARLFYHPNPGGDIQGMLDLTGRVYASYPTAFKYRKTLVQGCQCRPQPWTDSERARHRSYAATPDSSDRSAPPGVPPRMVVGNERHAIARPDPIRWRVDERPRDRSFHADPGDAAGSVDDRAVR